MLDMIKGFFRARLTKEQRIALDLHESIVQAARAPDLYLRAGIPDTLDGRVESISLHAFLLFHRMTGQPGWDAVGGALSDEIVADIDRSLREMGYGDMKIGKHVKKMSQIFFGRFDTYWGALTNAEGAKPLDAMLKRGPLQDRDVDPARLAALETYVHAQIDHLRGQSDADILVGKVSFAPAEPIFAALAPIEFETEGAV